MAEQDVQKKEQEWHKLMDETTTKLAKLQTNADPDAKHPSSRGAVHPDQYQRRRFATQIVRFVRTSPVTFHASLNPRKPFNLAVIDLTERTIETLGPELVTSKRLKKHWPSYLPWMYHVLQVFEQEAITFAASGSTAGKNRHKNPWKTFSIWPQNGYTAQFIRIDARGLWAPLQICLRLAVRKNHN